jgi:hypothetical protein
MEMFSIKILTKRKLSQLLQAERDRAFTEAVDYIVDLCKMKDKIHLDTVEVRNPIACVFNGVHLGCDTAVKIYSDDHKLDEELSRYGIAET